MTAYREEQQNLVSREDTNQTINDDEDDSVASGEKERKQNEHKKTWEDPPKSDQSDYVEDKPWYKSKCFIILIILLFLIAIIVLIIVLVKSGGDNPSPTPPTPDPPTPDPDTPAWCTGTNVLCVDDKVYNVLIDGNSVKIGGKSFSVLEVDRLNRTNGINTETTYSIFETIDAKIKTGTLTNGTATYSDGPITALWTGLLNEAGQPYGIGNLTATFENGPSYFVTTTMIDGVQTGFRQDYTYRIEQSEVRNSQFNGLATNFRPTLDETPTENLVYEGSSTPTSDETIGDPTGYEAYWLPIPTANMPILT